MTKTAETKHIAWRVVEYERGELDAEQTLDLFADLIRTGLAWQLQGAYGRTANNLIAAGLITSEGEVTDLGRRRLTSG